MDFNLGEVEAGIKARGNVHLVLADGIPVVTRSLADLGKRVEYLRGKMVYRIQPVDTFLVPVPSTAREQFGEVTS